MTPYFNSLLLTKNEVKQDCTASNVYYSSTYAWKAIPYVIGDYDMANKLPYAQNWTPDFHWQSAHHPDVVARALLKERIQNMQGAN